MKLISDKHFDYAHHNLVSVVSRVTLCYSQKLKTCFPPYFKID